MKPWLLRLHRWTALVLALPLIAVIGTGLVLSFEPWLVDRAITPGALTVETVQALLAQHDPQGKARGISYRSYDGTLTIGGGRGAAGTVLDAATGQVAAGPSVLASTLLTARRLHETLLMDMSWLVVGSSWAMLVLALLGVLIGWPRFANTVPGWHKAMAWGLLPLIVLSPLTGLLMAYRIGSAAPPPAQRAEQGAALALAEAVQIVGARHDLSGLVWLRPQGPRLLARLVEGGEYRVYTVTREGTALQPRNWPRLWHEGNFAGAWSALLNVVTSLAMVGLLVTGLWIWLRRQFRRSARRLQAAE